MLKVLTIMGTRPEAIKLVPVILELRKHQDKIHSRVCVTAQHRQMLDQVLDLFNIRPDIDLDMMEHNQSLPNLTAHAIKKVSDVLAEERPDIVLIQGDTTSMMAIALAAFYHKIAIGHVEAGLRSQDPYSPFPEEVNRRIAGVLSTYHFAPTETARKALLNEGVSKSCIFVTGNTVIDALHMIVRRPRPPVAETLLSKVGVSGSGDTRKIILVTAHRRENFGERFENICLGLKSLAECNSDIAILYPVHLNPNVQEPVYRILKGVKRVFLTDPLKYDVLVHLMNAAYLVLTDSGGIQEEAPALGKPVLVMRTETERPEAIEAGTAKLVGPYADDIVAETECLLRDRSAYQQMAQAVSPYGDGHAAERIVRIIVDRLAS